MFSARYAIPVMLLLAMASVPTLIHNYFGLTVSDGKTTSAIGNSFPHFAAIPSSRNPGWGEVTFECYDWFERIYSSDQGKAVRLFVGRSFDHKKLYHHPELALSYGADLARAEKTEFSLPPEITVYVLRSNGERGMAAYALLYEDRFIGNPVLHQLNNSLKLLVRPRKPLTLFYVSDNEVDSREPFAQTAMAQILTHAVRDFLATKGTPPL